MLTDILDDIYANDGWLSGSYVRERLVRQDMTTPVGDIDVIATVPYLDSLSYTLEHKYKATVDTLFEDVGMAHYHFIIGEYTFDIFFNDDHSYLSPPDVDVNTLCWTGKEFTTWFPFSEADDLYYSASFDINSIMDRARKKEAIAMTREWDNPDYYDEMNKRVMKLVNRGWTILNEF